VNLDGGNYIFDVENQRLLVAWAASRGKFIHERNNSRLKNMPKGGGDDVHRGHAIAHSLGGGLDINIVPQLGELNIGIFRTLEIEASKLPGSIYYSAWFYKYLKSQRASYVHQGIISETSLVNERKFSNVFSE
jgi:hypothetical protein